MSSMARKHSRRRFFTLPGLNTYARREAWRKYWTTRPKLIRTGSQAVHRSRHQSRRYKHDSYQ